MSCRKCGTRCHGRFCVPCRRDEHREDDISGDELSDENSDQDLLEYECTACSHEYLAKSLGCPECGAQRGRYIGELRPRT